MNSVILLVEDDEDLISIYKEILELHGFELQTAVNGEEAVEKFKNANPSLVIMDGDMPVLDGYEAFKQIKQIDKNAKVVMVTGYSQLDPKNQEAVKEGLIKIISKPLGVDELIALAQQYTEAKIKP
ncbi:response regulator [Nitrosopumilus adriaticus]|uniref:Response regulator receiver domain protein n=1 Tax=Nitrosopumilus adriaticus TaxID=1580092 RepID=A0A0D5C5U1_9ARCH|nr:response regulator [Nitrosopumilus adriaticus]AJW71735.1 Response regulator receiver domain protein [Nitrosopumilus adriaticus]